MSKSIVNKAFTLAEALVTLLIIGVVASLVIPGMVENYREIQLATAKKKVMNTLVNGYKNMVNDEMTMFEELPVMHCNGDFNCLSEIHRKYFRIINDMSNSSKGLPPKYSKVGSNDEINFKWQNMPYIFMTADGYVYAFVQDSTDSGYTGYSANNPSFSIVVDLNGKNESNKATKDLVKFRIDKNMMISEVSEELVNQNTGLSDISASAEHAIGDFDGVSGYWDGTEYKVPSNTCFTDTCVNGFWTADGFYSPDYSGYYFTGVLAADAGSSASDSDSASENHTEAASDQQTSDDEWNLIAFLQNIISVIMGWITK